MKMKFSFIFRPVRARRLAHERCVEKPGCLGCMPKGGSGVVRRVSGERHVARRLMEMGLLPGTPISVARVAPLGDPLELRLRGYALSIRRHEAMGVEIETASGAPVARS